MRTPPTIVSSSTSIRAREIAGSWAVDPAPVSSTARQLENERQNWCWARLESIHSLPCHDCPSINLRILPPGRDLDGPNRIRHENITRWRRSNPVRANDLPKQT